MPKVEILQQKGHNFLWIDDELWMWDMPVEVEAQKNLARQAFGKVLVVGYGLGIVHKFLRRNVKVTGFHTVEICSEVISANMMADRDIIGDYTYNDFFDWPSYDKTWDCIIGDLWLEMMPEYLDVYIAFKNKAEELLVEGGKVLAWGQDYFEYLLEKQGVQV